MFQTFPAKEEQTRGEQLDLRGDKIMELQRLEKAQIRSVGWEEEMWDTGNGWDREKDMEMRNWGILGIGMSQGLERGIHDLLGMKGIG